MKWDIDKALRPYEPESCPGTAIQRIMMDVKLFSRYGLRTVPPKAKLDARGQSVVVPSTVNVWCLTIGYSYSPTAQFYGHTIRECFLKARKAVKRNALDQATPWGKQAFKPKLKKTKTRKSDKALRSTP